VNKFTIVVSRIPYTIVAFGQTRNTAPSLMLFVPNGLTEYTNPFLLDVSVVQSSRWWFSSCSRCSSVVQSRWLFSSRPRCSLLKTVRLERFFDEVWLFPCTNPFLYFFLSGRRFIVPVPTLSAIPSCVRAVADLQKCPAVYTP
jgi:hypothetical protein